MNRIHLPMYVDLGVGFFCSFKSKLTKSDWTSLLYVSVVHITKKTLENMVIGAMTSGRMGAMSLATWYRPSFPPRSHYLVCIENHLFIVGIGPILNKELAFIFQSDRSDRTWVYS